MDSLRLFSSVDGLVKYDYHIFHCQNAKKSNLNNFFDPTLIQLCSENLSELRRQKFIFDLVLIKFLKMFDGDFGFSIISQAYEKNSIKL